MAKPPKDKHQIQRGLAVFQKEERGPGGWPTDPEVAFIEARHKLDEARKEAARWRSNHAALARRLRHLEGADRASDAGSTRLRENPSDPRTWRLGVSDKHIELYTELCRDPRAITVAEAAMLIELVDAWRDLEHRKHIALMATQPTTTSPE